MQTAARGTADLLQVLFFLFFLDFVGGFGAFSGEPNGRLSPMRFLMFWGLPIGVRSCHPFTRRLRQRQR